MRIYCFDEGVTKKLDEIEGHVTVLGEKMKAIHQRLNEVVSEKIEKIEGHIVAIVEEKMKAINRILKEVVNEMESEVGNQFA